MTFAGAVVDLDGTVYRDGHEIEGARKGIERLQSLRDGVLYVSNNPSHSPERYVDRLESIGVDTRPERVLSSGVVTTESLADDHAGDAVYLIGSDGLDEQLRDAGVDRCEDPTAADILLASWTPAFGYDHLVDALRAFETGSRFYGTDPDRTFPGDDGRPIPGSGAIIRSIAETAEREPDRLFGKPTDAMIDAITDRLSDPADEYLVIGDRLATDIALGERAGMTTVLVRTGIDEGPDPDADVTPDFVLDSLGDIDQVLDA
jgi:HAD superfamily hydrolase (TIGR01450 family)